MNKSHCIGCRNDFYNGKNPYSIEECWSFKTATLVWRKEVHVNDVPPWNQKPKRVPSCYSRPQFVYVNKDQKKISKI